MKKHTRLQPLFLAEVVRAEHRGVPVGPPNKRLRPACEAPVMPLRLLASLSVLAFMTLGCAGARKDLAPSAQPSVSSLTKRPVVGALGVPLGTVLEIRASVVAGDELVVKDYVGSYLLRVTEVNGRPLAPPPVLKFSGPVGEAILGMNHQLKNYVGKHVRLIAYETGQYSGVPHGLPDDVPVWADGGFRFHTSLVVLAERP